MPRYPLFLLALCLCPAPAEAAISVTEIQPLRFGNLIVSGAPPQRLILNPDGSETIPDGGINKSLPAQIGIAMIGGLPPGGNITVTLASPTTTQLNKAGSPDFDISDFTLDSSDGTYTANGAGNATIKIGSTLTTNTAASSYSDGAYKGTYTLNLIVDY